METFSSPRRFQLWDYSASHSQLLLRSARDETLEADENIDLLFSSVFYLEVTQSFDGLEVNSPSAEELAELELRAGVGMDEIRRRQFYILSSGGRRHAIGAAAMKVLRHSLPSNKSTLDFPRP